MNVDAEKNAEKVMNRNFAIIQSGHSILDANKIFLEKALTFAPVVTPMGEFLGLLTEKNLVKMNIEFQKDEKKNRIAHHEDKLTEFSSVHYKDSIEDIFKVIFSTDIYYVTVLNDGRKIVGTIDAKNLLTIINGGQVLPTDLRQQVLVAQEEKEHLHKEVQSSKDEAKFYKYLFEDAPLLMHSVDANGVIIAANKKLHEMLGYPPGELVGKTLDHLYPRSNQKLAHSGLKHIIRTGEHDALATSMKKLNGELLTVRLISSSIKDPDVTPDPRDPEKSFKGTITISSIVERD